MNKKIRLVSIITTVFAFAGTVVSQTPLLSYDFEEASGNYASKGALNIALIPNGSADAHGAEGSGVGGSRAWNAETPGAKQGLGKARLTLERDVKELNAPESLTIAFWYKTPEALAGNTRFLHKLTGNKSGYAIQVQNASTIQFALGDGTKANALAARSTTYGLKDAWVFFAVTLDGKAGQVKFYAGAGKSPLSLAGTQKYRGEIAASPAKLTIGNISAAADRGFVGQMDNFRLYDIALSQAQLEKLMAADITK
jgi:hypothetical protein